MFSICCGDETFYLLLPRIYFNLSYLFNREKVANAPLYVVFHSRESSGMRMIRKLWLRFLWTVQSMKLYRVHRCVIRLRYGWCYERGRMPWVVTTTSRRKKECSVHNNSEILWMTTSCDSIGGETPALALTHRIHTLYIAWKTRRPFQIIIFAHFHIDANLPNKNTDFYLALVWHFGSHVTVCIVFFFLHTTKRMLRMLRMFTLKFALRRWWGSAAQRQQRYHKNVNSKIYMHSGMRARAIWMTDDEHGGREEGGGGGVEQQLCFLVVTTEKIQRCSRTAAQNGKQSDSIDTPDLGFDK